MPISSVSSNDGSIIQELIALIEEFLEEMQGSSDDDDGGDFSNLLNAGNGNSGNDSSTPSVGASSSGSNGNGSGTTTPQTTSTGTSAGTTSAGAVDTAADDATSSDPVSLSTSIASDSSAASTAKAIMNDPTDLANNPLPTGMANRNEIYAAAEAEGVDPTFLGQQAEDESSDTVGQASASFDPEQTPGLIQASNLGASFGTGDEALNEALEGAKEDRQSVVSAESNGYSGHSAEVAGINAYNSGSLTEGWADAGDPRFPRSADNYFDAIMQENLVQDVSEG